MESFHISEQIKDLRKLREHYEAQLKFFGKNVLNFDEDLQADLNEYIEMQKLSNVYDLRIDKLKLYDYLKTKDEIEYTAQIENIQQELEQQETLIEQGDLECNYLQEFIASVDERKVSLAEIQSEKLLLEDKIDDLQMHLNSLSISSEINMDELLRKVEKLKKPIGKYN